MSRHKHEWVCASVHIVQPTGRKRAPEVIISWHCASGRCVESVTREIPIRVPASTAQTDAEKYDVRVHRLEKQRQKRLEMDSGIARRHLEYRIARSGEGGSLDMLREREGI